ncbi:MAG: DUF4129 domain-containing protein, partial [Limisphaerales bacterium]
EWTEAYRKKEQKKAAGPEPLNLAEESVHLLRTLPAKAWLQYAIGSMPFMLGLLYFFADISHGAYGYSHLATSSLLMACLYLWLKFWQSAFAQSIAATLYGREAQPWTPRRIWNVTIINAVVHPVGMLLFPLCALIFVPLPTVYGFFHSLTFVADGEDPSLRANISRAGRLARKWYGNNLSFLFLIKFFVFLVYLNWMILLAFLPELSRIFFGTNIAQLGAADLVFNTTFQAAVIMLTWLCVSPITRAAYSLRCFYGESIESGADLKAELKFIRGGAMKAVLAGLALVLLGTANASAAEPVPPPGPQPSGERTKQLDRRIQDVLERPEFSWRSPRQEPAVEAEEGMGGTLSKTVADLAARAMEKLADGVRAVVDWLGDRFDSDSKKRKRRTRSSSEGWDWGGIVDKALWVLAFAVAIAFIFLGVRLWKQRPVSIAMAEPVAPDLTAEDVTADELPEDDWLNLAHDLLNKGDSRLALRALYLACLAHLGERELVTISRAKSNREYQRELKRRARLLEELRSAFTENVQSFERVWYGVHEVTRAMFDHFEQNLHRIRQC